MGISSASKVGMITILAIIVLGLIFTQIGDWKDKELGYTFVVNFDQISGLQKNAKVSMSGVTVGKVKDIKIINYKVKVTVLITYPDLTIPKNSKIFVAGSLWGDKWVEIVPATGGGKITNDQEVSGQNTVSIEQFIGDAKTTMDELKKTVTFFNNLVGDPKTQKNFKSTIANFNKVSENLIAASSNSNLLIEDIRAKVAVIGSQVEGFSSFLNRMTGTNEGDIRLIVKNLKQASVSVNKSMDQLNKIVSDKGLSQDILTTVASLRKAGEEISGIAYDIHTISSDPQVQSDIKETITQAKNTVENANKLFKKLNNMVGPDSKDGQSKLIDVYAENEWGKSTGTSYSNINAYILPYGFASMKLGADSIGYSTLYNAQVGKRFNNFMPRFGVIRSNLGIGVDANFSKNIDVSLDAYNTRNVEVDLIGRLNVWEGFYLYGGSRNMFSPNNHLYIFGAGKKF